MGGGTNARLVRPRHNVFAPSEPPGLFHRRDRRRSEPAGLGAVDLTNPQSLNRNAYALNNPTTLTDPLGLCPGCPPGQSAPAQTCGRPGTTVPQGQNPAVWCYNNLGIAGGSGADAFFTNPFSVMDYFGIPVVTDTYNAAQFLPSNAAVSAEGYEVTTTVIIPGSWTTIQVGDALDLLAANNGNNFSWWGAFGSNLFSWQNIKQNTKDAWNNGYYPCIGNEMFPFKGLFAAGGAVFAEHFGLEAAGAAAPDLAGAYYHFTDGRFTAWGSSSNVLVPEAAEGIRGALQWAKVGGLAVTDLELAHAIYTCSGKL